MPFCTNCSSSLTYTTYIRVTRRGAKSHRSKQQFLPAGRLCLSCGTFQATLDLALQEQILRRRRGSSNSRDQ